MDSTPQFADLKAYLARPKRFATGFLADGSDRFFSYAFSSAFLRNALARASGAHGVRFKMVLTLQVSGNPFASGGVYMCAIPSVAAITDYGETAYTMRQLPHVILDIAETTATRLEYPFIMQEDFFVLNASNGFTYANVHLGHVVPYTSPPGTPAISYNIYYHFEDVEFIGIVPSDIAIAQSGKDITVREDEVCDKGGVYGPAIGLFSAGVPKLSSLMGTSAWALRKAADMAKAFGYSKNLVTTPPAFVTPQLGIREHYVDQPTNRPVLAPFATTSLQLGPHIANTDVDEMALEHLFTRFSHIHTGSLNSSDASGTYPWRCTVSPAAFYYNDGDKVPMFFYNEPLGDNAFYPSVLTYFSSLFDLWRGSFKFRFKFFKTKFHAGRIAVTFVPHHQFLTGNKTNYHVPKTGIVDGATTIFNLRDGSEFEYVVPYMSAKPFLRHNDTLGTISVQLIDSLVAPASVQPSIGFTIEVSACPGFQVSQYSGPRFKPSSFDAPAVAQSGEDVTLHDASAINDCHGEVFSSVKQVIMMPTRDHVDMIDESTTIFYPWWCSLYSESVTTVYASAYAACCYAWARGSTDFDFYTNTKNGTRFIATVLPTSSLQPTHLSSVPSVVGFDHLHVRLPSYGRFRRFEALWNYGTHRHPSNFINGSSDVPSSQVNSTLLMSASGGLQSVFCSRSAGDDAQLGFFLGVPFVRYLKHTAEHLNVEEATGFPRGYFSKLPLPP